MSNTQFVLMYSPTNGNKQANVPLQSVDDWALRGWLLVDGQTPAPAPTALTTTLGDLRYLKLGDVSNPTSTGGVALRAASVAAVKASGAVMVGAVVDQNLHLLPGKGLFAKATADGLDIDDLFIGTVA